MVQRLKSSSEKPMRDLTRARSDGTLCLAPQFPRPVGAAVGGVGGSYVHTHASLGVPFGMGQRPGHASPTRFSELGRGRGEKARSVRAGPSDVGAAGGPAPFPRRRGGHFLALPTFCETNERTPPASRAAQPGT